MTKPSTRESPPQRSEQPKPRHQNTYDYDGEYEFNGAQHGSDHCSEKVQMQAMSARIRAVEEKVGPRRHEGEQPLARMDHAGPPTPKRTSRLGTIALVVVLLGLLVAATLYAIRGWTSIEGPPMPEVGYVAMTIGVVLSLLVGIALMTLLFYSSRHGYDE
jgi:hypothetical protein